MNQQAFIFLTDESSRGGLFDIGATLPLVAVQFLFLMFILNILLYNPILTVVDERNEYVLDNLSKTSEMLLAATELTIQYEKELISTKKESKTEILKLQKLQKERFDTELRLSQSYIDKISQKILDNFVNKKTKLISNLQSEIDLLSNQMLTKLSIKVL
jgi:F-type H+-transporting ATPase subunit b